MANYRIMMIPNVRIWGGEDVLLQVALRIYANFHKSSRRTLKRHLPRQKSQRNWLRKIKELADNDKRMSLIEKECLG